MDLKKLETFRIVAIHGSLGHAAAQHGITLPAVSIQIKRLETELGVKLFDHRPKKLVLTEQGEKFLQEVNHIFEALDRARNVITSPSEGFVGKVSISLSTDLARFFAPGVAAFVKSHPNLNVAILARPSSETMVQVMNGEIDMGVGFYGKVPSGITKRKILETNISAIYPRGHPLENIKNPSLGEIVKYGVIMRRRFSVTRSVIDGAFPNYLADHPNVLEVGGCQSAMDFVKLGLGVGFVHDICACADPRDDLSMMSLERYFGKMEVGLVTRTKAVLGQAHQALIQTIFDNAAVEMGSQRQTQKKGKQA